MLKRLIAKRTLQRQCAHCRKSFRKGEVYYKKRTVFFDNDGTMFSNEWLICSKCKYKIEEHFKRFEGFKTRCIHPGWAIETEYSYMPGECVQEPDYDYCRLCGQIRLG